LLLFFIFCLHLVARKSENKLTRADTTLTEVVLLSRSIAVYLCLFLYMFKGLLTHAGAESRAARRLATVAHSARLSRKPHLRETVRRSTQQLHSLRERRRQGRHAQGGATGALTAVQASWTVAQADELAQEDAAWRARDPRQRYAHPHPTSSSTGDDGDKYKTAQHPSSSSTIHYDAVDPETGDSVVQQNFNELVFRALLRYGPPLPVDVVMHNKVISVAAMSPEQRRAHFNELHCRSSGGSGSTDDPNAVYMDEVGLRMHEFMSILRKEQPDFSVRDDCDGVPLSLMVRNCSFLRAYGGRVNYMRFVRRLPAPGASSKANPHGGGACTMVVSLGKYKMQEMPSQDGIRQGPQPWRYSYRTL
jgi:hypothetical protein